MIRVWLLRFRFPAAAVDTGAATDSINSGVGLNCC
jgi:hypothetical protein